MKGIFALFIFITLINSASYAQNTDALNYIKQNAIAITVNADSDYQDLIPLKTIFANRRIIGMGEATHATHEFQITKARMLQFLVEQMGYKLFGIEANFPECLAVNDYVMYGKGDVRSAIAGIYFWTWRTNELLKMVEWMRHYNMNKADTAKVKFYGFDMQFGNGALISVAEKLKKFDNAYYNTHFKVFDTLKMEDNSKTGYKKFSNEGADSIRLLFTTITHYIDSNHTDLLKMYTANDIAYMKHNVRILEQCLDGDIAINKYSDFNMYAGRNRDKCMAENIEWLLNYEGPQSKIMLWAHNAHISKGEYDMGSYLKKDYKEQYYAIGFDFNKGSFRAVDHGQYHRGISLFKLDDSEKGSSGKIFSQLNIPAFFIDIESAVNNNTPAKSFFMKSIKQRSIGAAFNQEEEKLYYWNEPLYDVFDGLIFVNDTTPTTWMKINKK